MGLLEACLIGGAAHQRVRELGATRETDFVLAAALHAEYGRVSASEPCAAKRKALAKAERDAG
jgi:hypothetical protein